MTLSDLASIGSFISGLAVLVSLVFLYFQLRQVGTQVQQAERNQQASIRQGRATRVVAMNLAATEPSLADALAKVVAGATGMTNTQLTQYGAFCRATFLNGEDSFFQHKDGLLSDASFASYTGGMLATFSLPGFRVQWKYQRGIFASEYVAFMDKLVVEAPKVSLVDRVAQWNADIATEASA
jgi:hypothetical protein